MTENELIKKAIEYIKVNEPPFINNIFCRAPHFKFGRQDFFNAFDLMILYQNGQVSFYQITTKHHLSDRRKKIKELLFLPIYSFLMGYDEKNDNWIIENLN